MTETLDSILSGTGDPAPAPEPVITETAPPEPSSQPRQPDGKWAPKPSAEPASTAPPAPPEPAPQAQTTAPQTTGTVPVAAVHAAREKTREKDAEIAELRGQIAQLSTFVQRATAPHAEKPPPAPPPDPFADPEGYTQHRVNEALTPLQRQLEDQRHFFSRSMAETKYGEESVNTALEAMAGAVNSDPEAAAEYQRIMQSPSPYAALVQWHRKRTALTEIGEDPTAYKARIRAEVLAEMGGQPPGTPPAPATPQPTPIMPSNFAGARNVGTRSGPAWGGPASLSDIFDRTKKKAG